MTLAGALDIFEASLVQSEALKAWTDTQANAIFVDVTKVERFDLTAIQLLLALWREVLAEGRSFMIRGDASQLAGYAAPIGVCFEP